MRNMHKLQVIINHKRILKIVIPIRAIKLPIPTSVRNKIHRTSSLNNTNTGNRTKIFRKIHINVLAMWASPRHQASSSPIFYYMNDNYQPGYQALDHLPQQQDNNGRIQRS